MTTIGPATVQSGPDRQTSSSAPSGGDVQGTASSFADLLAGLVKPCNGPDGFLEDRTDIISHGRAAQQAAVFNGSGLFYGIPASGSATTASPSPGRLPNMAGGRSDPVPLASSRDVAVSIDRPVAAEIADAVPIAGVRSRSQPMAGLRLDSISTIASTTPDEAPPSSTALPVSSVIDPDHEPAGTRLDRTARLTRTLDDNAAKASVGVTLHASEAGATVVAHAGTAQREDRAKLRDRIVALLTRHGLVARGVRIDSHSDISSFLRKDR